MINCTLSNCSLLIYRHYWYSSKKSKIVVLLCSIHLHHTLGWTCFTTSQYSILSASVGLLLYLDLILWAKIQTGRPLLNKTPLRPLGTRKVVVMKWNNSGHRHKIAQLTGSPPPPPILEPGHCKTNVLQFCSTKIILVLNRQQTLS